MELAEVIRRRRMTRSFDGAALDHDTLHEVLDAARHAPSAGFAQGLDLVALTAADRRGAFWELASEAAWRDSPGAAELLAAPAIVVPVINPAAYVARYRAPDKLTSLLAGREAPDWPVPYWLIDAAFATMLMLLRATDVGLGALFFQLHGDEASVLAGLGVPAGRHTIGAVALGAAVGTAPIGSAARLARRPYAEVVHEDGW